MLEPFSFVRAVHFAATLLLAGTLFFESLIIMPTGIRVADVLRRQLSWLLWICVTVVPLSGAIWLIMLAGSISGDTIAEAVQSGTAATLLTETRFGWVWIIRLVMLVIIAASLPRRLGSRLQEWAALIAAASLLTTLALSGHSGATPGLDGAAYLSVDVVHLLASAIWVGGLLPLALLLNHARRSNTLGERKAAQTITRRFSLFAVSAVATLIATGTVNSWHLVGSLDALLTAAYGRLLLQKIALVAVMLGFATINRYWLTRRMTEPRALLGLWRNTVVETGLGALVLIVVGFLGTTPPGTHGDHASHAIVEPPDDSAFVHIHGAQAMADLIIAPGRAGIVRITVHLMRETLEPLPAERLSLTLVHPDRAEPLVLPVRPAGPGEWKAGPTTLPLSGIWTAKLDVTLGPNAEEVLDGPIVLEPAQQKR